MEQVRKYDGHLLNRIDERIGNGIDPIRLKSDLVKALIEPEKYHEYVERVKRLRDGASIWRFRVLNDCVHYVIASEEGNPMTVITQKMLRRYKR